MDKLKEKGIDEKAFEEMVETTFAQADLNQNSTIERNELALLLKKIYVTLGIDPPSESDIDNEYKRLDKNSDGKLNKEEFKILVKDLALFSAENICSKKYE